MALNPLLVSSQWLSACSSALHNADVAALANLFLSNGWLRDILVFTWDIRSLEGPEKITTYLADRLLDAHITDVQLDNTPHLAPHTDLGVEFAFTFECNRGHGRAYVRLAPDADDTYRALSMLTELVDLRGYEELSTLPLRDDVTGVPGKDMQNDYEDMVRNVEADPYVIIVGAAQTGLQVAARFKQMNIPTLVIERAARIGDVWRQRYPTLVLHTTRKHHTLLYQPFPSNWPEFTPRDKYADWLEHYASIQDHLIVWTSSELNPHPTYNAEDHRWDVTISRNGSKVKLRPAHIVLATGTLGRPVVPDVLGMEGFQGRILHSSRFPGGAAFAAQHAVVVGAGNSSIDICQDLALRGAASVTMVQRSTTCVMSRDFTAPFLKSLYPDDVPLDISDFKVASAGMGLRKRQAIEAQAFVLEAHRELHEKLRGAGVSVNLGPEGEGIYPLVYERLGGYWIDKGGADLIADGRIKVKSGVSVQRFTKTGLILSDGTELTANVVIFATGFVHIRETNRELLGDSIVDQIEEVYGLDDEGELKGSYRPCGHPGLWFATGDIPASRYLSKALSLQIKAIEIGLMPNNGRRSV